LLQRLVKPSDFIHTILLEIAAHHPQEVTLGLNSAFGLDSNFAAKMEIQTEQTKDDPLYYPVASKPSSANGDTSGHEESASWIMLVRVSRERTPGGNVGRRIGTTFPRQPK